MRNLTIRARLIALMLLSSILLIIVAGAGLMGMSAGNDALQEMQSNQLASLTELAGADVNLQRGRLTLDRGVMTVGEAGDMNSVLDRARMFFKDADKNWQNYMKLPQAATEKALAEDVARLRAVFLEQGANALMTALAAGDREQSLRLAVETMPVLYRPVNAALEKLNKHQMDLAVAAFQASQSRYEQLRLLNLGLLAFGLVVSIISSIFLLRAIGRPLDAAIGHFDKIAAGDLTTHIVIEAGPRTEMGRLLGALSRTQQSLAGIVEQVRDGTASIGVATQQIVAGNTDLSQRTEEQASSLEETASSMEELTSIVRQNADNARQASTLAASASGIATKGGDVVQQVVGTMADINDSSRKIVDIIGVIEGIAFQTNILALNAAVEAARAGEQGRGFAVVAGEVRSLAQRSAEAAKEIKALITDSVSRVENGSELVDQAGRTMGEIVEAVKRVADIMGEISAASEEQSSGIEQVNQAVSQMDEVTQQNAALVEEAAAAAESLEEQAQRLTEVVSVFRVRNAGVHATEAAAMKKSAQRGPRVAGQVINAAASVPLLPTSAGTAASA
ncbi:MAG TPA: methyl-accepting chemotaxis protein [Burkholderiaceae bacterium]|nr:methyl-accepting chemotaxis protein [Burkholderiaceae bacterium]